MLKQKSLNKIKVPKILNEAMSTFEREVGGRAALVDSLVTISDNPDMSYVLGLIADPDKAKMSLAEICTLGGLSLSKLLSYYRDATGMKAQLKAYDKVFKLLPTVTEDLMKASLTTTKLCYKCFGKQTIKVSWITADEPSGTREVECTSCGGTGRVEIQPDIETRKIALQMGGMIRAPGSPTVNVNTQINSQTNTYTNDDAKKFRSATDRILYPGKQKALPSADDFVNAEVTESE